MLSNIYRNQDYCFHQSFLEDLLENEFQIIKMTGKTLTGVLVVSIKYVISCGEETDWEFNGAEGEHSSSDGGDAAQLHR